MPYENDAEGPHVAADAPAATPVATPAAPPTALAGALAGALDQIRLIGQPPLSDYLDFVRKSVVGGEAQSRREIVDAWRVANDHLAVLERKEAGLADKARRRPLPKAMLAAAAELEQSEHYRWTFDKVPTEIAMVELDRLVVSQRHVTLPFVEALAARLSPKPGPEALFRFCQPLERRDPPVTIQRLARDRYAFVSDSNDLRFHRAAMLPPDAVRGFETFGPVAGILGIAVGYGSNFLCVIRSDDRMVLHNGYHRACALRQAGIAYAPAIVQTVTRRDELDITAAQAVVDDPAFYFRARRPPLLKDFFDPRLRVVLPVRRSRKMIEVTFEVTELDPTET